MKIKQGDFVAIIAGKDQFTVDKKGVKQRKTGKVLKVFPKTNRVIVEGVNIATIHEAPKGQGDAGTIVKKESPIHVSNVALVDKKTNERIKIGYKFTDAGKKVRIAKKTGKVLD